jgi:hypothetical protein
MHKGKYSHDVTVLYVTGKFVTSETEFGTAQKKM